MNLALLVAILSPFIFGLLNIFDKYVVSHKVKDTLSYSPMPGIISVLFGLVVACFLSWNNLKLSYLPKLGAILLIVLGVVLLTIFAG